MTRKEAIEKLITEVSL